MAAVAVIFGALWRMGYIARLSNYAQATKEELRKCTWPTADELKGSTLVVVITIFLLGAYTMGIDFVINLLVNVLNTINKTA